MNKNQTLKNESRPWTRPDHHWPVVRASLSTEGFSLKLDYLWVSSSFVWQKNYSYEETNNSNQTTEKSIDEISWKTDRFRFFDHFFNNLIFQSFQKLFIANNQNIAFHSKWPNGYNGFLKSRGPSGSDRRWFGFEKKGQTLRQKFGQGVSGTVFGVILPYLQQASNHQQLFSFCCRTYFEHRNIVNLQYRNRFLLCNEDGLLVC